MTDYSLTPWLLPLLLYAETHYRFRYFFSYLKKPEPELIADAPHFVEPNRPVPLLVLSKDAHRYPCKLLSIRAKVSHDNKIILDQELLSSPLTLQEHFWWRVFHLELPQIKGWVEVDVTFEIEVNGRKGSYHNDNHKTSSHQPLRVYVARKPLPRFDGLYFGDCHTHSTYTDDQVEFGSPIEASVELCKRMGLSFFCVTDHSYDLDDHIDDYLKNDPTLPKWRSLQNKVDVLNRTEKDFAVIRGEEVSCRNAEGKNVHLLLFGNKDFFPGAGDSAEQWLRTRSELNVQKVLLFKGETVAAIAAHPRERVPFLQRVLLERGQWADEDLFDDRLHGIQFANGSRDEGYQEGYRAWINALLSGKRLYAYGGNDAHGNFNRFRQIGIPFFRIREEGKQLFGQMRTGVFLEDEITEAALLHSFQSGRAIVTDGPVLNFGISKDQLGTIIGSQLVGKRFQIYCSARSSIDYGQIECVKVLKGCIGKSTEELVLDERPVMSSFVLDRAVELNVEQPLYLRAELYTCANTAFDKKPHFALTNPVWFRPV